MQFSLTHTHAPSHTRSHAHTHAHTRTHARTHRCTHTSFPSIPCLYLPASFPLPHPPFFLPQSCLTSHPLPRNEPSTRSQVRMVSRRWAMMTTVRSQNTVVPNTTTTPTTSRHVSSMHASHMPFGFLVCLQRKEVWEEWLWLPTCLVTSSHLGSARVESSSRFLCRRCWLPHRIQALCFLCTHGLRGGWVNERAG